MDKEKANRIIRIYDTVRAVLLVLFVGSLFVLAFLNN